MVLVSLTQNYNLSQVKSCFYERILYILALCLCNKVMVIFLSYPPKSNQVSMKHKDAHIRFVIVQCHVFSERLT